MELPYDKQFYVLLGRKYLKYSSNNRKNFVIYELLPEF
jgi:hypothetical protein